MEETIVRTIDKIRGELIDRDTYILIPKSLKDTALPMSRMQKDLEDGTLLNEFYSVQDLNNEFGTQYTLEEWVTPDHIIATWASYANGEMETLKAYLVSMGLINIRDNGTEHGLTVDMVDWTTITAGHFAVITKTELRNVPKGVSNDTVSI